VLPGHGPQVGSITPGRILAPMTKCACENKIYRAPPSHSFQCRSVGKRPQLPMQCVMARHPWISIPQQTTLYYSIPAITFAHLLTKSIFAAPGIISPN